MIIKYQLKFMTGMLYLVLAELTSNIYLAALFCVIASVDMFEAHLDNYKREKKTEELLRQKLNEEIERNKELQERIEYLIKNEVRL